MPLNVMNLDNRCVYLQGETFLEHYSNISRMHFLVTLSLGLPTVPYFPGRPVFWPHFPTSLLRPSRDVKCPVFRPWTNCIEVVEQMYAGS